MKLNIQSILNLSTSAQRKKSLIDRCNSLNSNDEGNWGTASYKTCTPNYSNHGLNAKTGLNNDTSERYICFASGSSFTYQHTYDFNITSYRCCK